MVELLAPREEEFKDDRLFAYLLGNALLRANELLRGQAYIDRLFQRRRDRRRRACSWASPTCAAATTARRVPELERAVALNPALPAAHSLLGRALMGAGRRDEAMAAFRPSSRATRTTSTRTSTSGSC